MLKRIRVISDNDYAGDPDGLVQLAHLLLSPSVEVVGVVGSHLRDDGVWPIPENSAQAAAHMAKDIVNLCKLGYPVPVVAGSESPMPDLTTPTDSDAVNLIIREAMRDDTHLPLWVVCGGGLTAIASAWIKEPRIAEKLTLVWIGGHEYEQTASVAVEPEYNSLADLNATRVVFNQSNLALWQVPRDSYGTTLVSQTELENRMVASGPLGDYIWDKYETVHAFIEGKGWPFGEVLVIGDSPLVLLTALQLGMDSQPTSSQSSIRQRPSVDEHGIYGEPTTDSKVRVFGQLDNRLMIEDFFEKMAKRAKR